MCINEYFINFKSKSNAINKSEAYEQVFYMICYESLFYFLIEVRKM